ncbi:MAG TPA: molybdopterin-synthase adenylyltransferase MoeB [bacterium]|nr:molybdopterin-synthase adenylyltransferase MoeB [bacterium]
MPSFRDQLAQLKADILEVPPAEALAAVEAGAVLLDVRESEETREGHLPGAVCIPRGFLEMKIEGAVPDRSTPIVAYCASGTRSLFAAQTLRGLGYENVRSMAGGFTRWKDEGRPYETPVALDAADRKRYARHLAIPEVGEAGQARLLTSKVLLIGAGGLGSPAAYYLAAAGVGTLGLVDFDVVDESNLQRQILHTADRVGTPKVESARRTLLGYNPRLNLQTFEERLTSANAQRIVAGFDLVVDGADNFPTRYLVNDACVLLRKPNVHGSVYRFDGQVTVFAPHLGGPCYRCLYPEPPPPELAPNCAEAGVLGVLPGVIGLLQAVETLKLLLGIGHPYIGRLLTYEALSGRFRELRQARDPGCAYCGEGMPFPGFVDYEQFCASAGH